MTGYYERLLVIEFFAENVLYTRLYAQFSLTRRQERKMQENKERRLKVLKGEIHRDKLIGLALNR